MPCHLAEDCGQRPHTELRMRWDRDVVLTVLLRRQAEVAPGLTGHRVAEDLKRSREVRSRKVPRQPNQSARLGRNDFVANDVQPDHPGAIRIVEMTADGVPDRAAQCIKVIRLGHDRGIDGVGDKAPFRGFGNNEQNLGHACPPCARVSQ